MVELCSSEEVSEKGVMMTTPLAKSLEFSRLSLMTITWAIYPNNKSTNVKRIMKPDGHLPDSQQALPPTVPAHQEAPPYSNRF